MLASHPGTSCEVSVRSSARPRAKGASLSEKKAVASPFLPARPVRPMRWTFFFFWFFLEEEGEKKERKVSFFSSSSSSSSSGDEKR